MPVATAAHTGSGCVGRIVARSIDAPASSTRPKFGSRPAATRGQTYSSDAPSRSSSVMRGESPRPAAAPSVTRRAPSGSAPPAPRAAIGSASEPVIAIDEQRRADPAAAPAERVVRDRDAEQHDRGRRRRAGAEREAPRRGLVEERRKAVEVEPHQRRGDRRRHRRQPRQQPHADPAGRKDVDADELAQQHRDVEEEREVHAVEHAERRVPAPHRVRHAAAPAGSTAARGS